MRPYTVQGVVILKAKPYRCIHQQFMAGPYAPWQTKLTAGELSIKSGKGKPAEADWRTSRGATASNREVDLHRVRQMDNQCRNHTTLIPYCSS